MTSILRAKFHANRGENKAENESVIAMLERAVAIDPEFGAAHAELAYACVIRLFIFTPQEEQRATLPSEIWKSSFWSSPWILSPSHPAFQGKVLVNHVFLSAASKSPCFADDAGSAQDHVGHGTHVAGIVAGQGTPLFPAAQGVAKGVTFLYTLKTGAKLSGAQGCGSNAFFDQDVLSALEWAVFNSPLKILNMSFGGDTDQDDSGLARLVDLVADTYDLTIAVAAGNSGARGLGSVGSPGIGYNIISVANWDTHGTPEKDDDLINPSSSKGPTAGGRFKPDVAAPGTAILSADYRSTGYIELTGTSMASPHVAGAAALLHQAGLRTPLAIKATLINTTDNVG